VYAPQDPRCITEFAALEAWYELPDSTSGIQTFDWSKFDSMILHIGMVIDDIIRTSSRGRQIEFARPLDERCRFEDRGPVRELASHVALERHAPLWISAVAEADARRLVRLFPFLRLAYEHHLADGEMTVDASELQCAGRSIRDGSVAGGLLSLRCDGQVAAVIGPVDFIERVHSP
jgi:hypothetical protein